MESLPLNKKVDKHWEIKDREIPQSWKVTANFLGNLQRRGHFLTRRNEACWKNKLLSEGNPEGTSRDIPANSGSRNTLKKVVWM